MTDRATRKRERARLRMRRWIVKPENRAKRDRYRATPAAKELDRIRQRRYRATHREKMKQAAAVYGRSQSGREAKRRAMAKYRKTEKYQKWLLTKVGADWNERRLLGLPATAPKALVRSIRLLQALKQEKRKWTSTN